MNGELGIMNKECGKRNSRNKRRKRNKRSIKFKI